MADDKPIDYYDLLQVSSTAEPETIHRVYRLLAQRYHPDNQETGNEGAFARFTTPTRCQRPREAGALRHLCERARQERFGLVETGASRERFRGRATRPSDGPGGALYPARVDPADPGACDRPREHDRPAA